MISVSVFNNFAFEYFVSFDENVQYQMNPTIHFGMHDKIQINGIENKQT